MIAIDNGEAIAVLNDTCTSVQDVAGQETWLQGDGSYSNKETSRWDEAKDWEGVCIPSPIRAR